MAPKQVKAAKAGKKQKVKKAPPKKVVQEASEESSDEDSEEEEIETPVVKKKAKPVVRAKEEDSDDSSEEDSDEEEETPAINGAKAKLSEKKNGKTEENDDEDDEDDDDDEDDEEEEEEEEAPPPKAKPQKRKDKPAAKPKQQAMEVEEDEDDDEDDSEEEEDDSDSEEEAVSNNQGKRKKGQADKPSKKAKTDTVTLFVNRLSTKTTEETLKSFLEENGVGVKSIQRLPKKKFAFVVLEDPADLDKAVALSGQTLEDKEIMIEKAKAEPRSPPPAATPDKPKASPVKKGNTEDEEEGSKLVVKNLSKTVTEDMLKEAFPTAVSMRMPLFPDGNSRGFAFLTFESTSEAQSIMEEKQGLDIDGQEISLGPFKNKPPRERDNRRSSSGEAGKSKVLFIGNLNYDSTEDGVKEYFPNATAVRILTHQDTGRSKGFGFVEFSNAEDAQKAFDERKGEVIDDREVSLDFAQERGQGGGRGRGFHGGRGGRGGGFRGGRGGGGFRGGRGGFRGRGGDRGGRGGFRGRGGGDRGRGGRGRGGGFVQGSGKKTTFDDSD